MEKQISSEDNKTCCQQRPNKAIDNHERKLVNHIQEQQVSQVNCEMKDTRQQNIEVRILYQSIDHNRIRNDQYRQKKDED